MKVKNEQHLEKCVCNVCMERDFKLKKYTDECVFIDVVWLTMCACMYVHINMCLCSPVGGYSAHLRYV